MKKYINVKIIPNYRNTKQYLLMLETNQGYMDEVYPIIGKEEAKKAYRNAKWLMNHHYVKQDFVGFNVMNNVEKRVVKGLVSTMYAISKIEEYVFN